MRMIIPFQIFHLHSREFLSNFHGCRWKSTLFWILICIFEFWSVFLWLPICFSLIFIRRRRRAQNFFLYKNTILFVAFVYRINQKQMGSHKNTDQNSMCACRIHVCMCSKYMRSLICRRRRAQNSYLYTNIILFVHECVFQFLSS